MVLIGIRRTVATLMYQREVISPSSLDVKCRLFLQWVILITTAAYILWISLLYVLCFNKSVVWRQLEGDHWSCGYIKDKTRPWSLVTALLWLTHCYIYILPAGDKMYDFLKVKYVIVPCSYHYFYTLHKAIVRPIVIIQITDIPLQTPWLFALV